MAGENAQRNSTRSRAQSPEASDFPAGAGSLQPWSGVSGRIGVRRDMRQKLWKKGSEVSVEGIVVVLKN